jgi:hypothetical protein
MGVFPNGITVDWDLPIIPATLIPETGAEISIHSQVSAINEWLVIT